MKKYNIVFLFVLIFCLNNSVFAQNSIQVIVQNNENEALEGAMVWWNGTTFGGATDSLGRLLLGRKKGTDMLKIRYIGYIDTLLYVSENETEIKVKLLENNDLNTVVVQANETTFSLINPLNVETIGGDELRRAPCCNLSESFQNNPAVNISYSDAVTGAKEIQLLGLRGIYAQLLVENRPSLQGLAGAYGLEYLSGTWLNSIQVSKGAATVINGSQSLTGQINSELIKPFNAPRLFVNGFLNHLGRGELNVQINKKWNDKWSTGLLSHANYFQTSNN